jgi:hypothetical protein
MRGVFESRNGNDHKFKSILNYGVKFYQNYEGG